MHTHAQKKEHTHVCNAFTMLHKCNLQSAVVWGISAWKSGPILILGAVKQETEVSPNQCNWVTNQVHVLLKDMTVVCATVESGPQWVKHFSLRLLQFLEIN